MKGKAKLKPTDFINKVNEILLSLREDGFNLPSCLFVAEILRKGIKINMGIVETKYKEANKKTDFFSSTKKIFKEIDKDSDLIIKESKYRETTEAQINKFINQEKTPKPSYVN